MFFRKFALTAAIRITVMFLLISSVYSSHAEPFTYHWEIDETPFGSESVSVVQPVEVILVDEPVKVSYSTASLQLRQQYGVHLSDQWNSDLAQLLLLAFESVPQYWFDRENDLSYWTLMGNNLPEDIVFANLGKFSLVSISYRTRNIQSLRK